MHHARLLFKVTFYALNLLKKISIIITGIKHWLGVNPVKHETYKEKQQKTCLLNRH